MKFIEKIIPKRGNFKKSKSSHRYLLLASVLAAFFINVPFSHAAFSAAVNYPVGNSPYPVASADYDGDGDQDLAVGNVQADTVSILFNNGVGVFGAATNYATGGSCLAGLFAGDLDGDLDIDLASSNCVSNDISILLNSGTGTFAPAVLYATGGLYANEVRGADIDGDADIDLLTPNSDTDNISIFHNNGNGTFAAAINESITAASGPNSLSITDVDGDTDFDLVTANIYNDTVTVLINQGSEIFAAPVNYAAGLSPFTIKATDLDGDTDMDFIVTDSNLFNGGNVADTMSIFINQGAGILAARVPYSTGPLPFGVEVGDFDGDGDMDVAVTSDGNKVSIFPNNGNGTFAAGVPYTVGTESRDIAAIDLDGDVDLDLAVTNNSSNDVSILFNDLNATLHVIKHVVNDNGGITVASSFNLHVKNGVIDVAGSPAPGAEAPGITYNLLPASYEVSEDAIAGYTSTFSGDCDPSGNITLASDEDKTCTITNDDIAPPPPPVPSNNGGGGGCGYCGDSVPTAPVPSSPSPSPSPQPSPPPSSPPPSSLPSPSTPFFTDVALHWAEQYIVDLQSTCGVNGYTDNSENILHTFKPNDEITRAELLTMVIKCKMGVLPQPPKTNYSDVEPDFWGSAYIQKAADLGIVEGFPDGTFKPNQNTTRAEALKIILLTQFEMQEINSASVSTACTDIISTEWYAQYFNFALNKGIINGYLDTAGNPIHLCEPSANITRAESAKIIIVSI